MSHINNHVRSPGHDDAGDRLLPAAAWRAWWDAACDRTDPFVDLARAQGWVVTRAQALEHGAADHDLRRWVRRGLWWIPRYGALSPIVPGDDARRVHSLSATSAVLVRPGTVISGRSSAILHGLPTVRVPEAPEITRRTSTTGRRTAAHVYGATLVGREVGEWFGAPTTTIARTLVDLGRHDAWDAVMAADAAYRERLVTAAEVRRALVTATGWPGIRRARDVLAHADPRAESPLESVTRWRLHESGFPAPELQFRIGGYVVDLCWPELRFVLECDGSVKYRGVTDLDGGPLWREKRREAVLRQHGYDVDRVIWSDVTRDWRVVSERLARRLHR